MKIFGQLEVFCSIYHFLLWFSEIQIINKVSEELPEYTESLEEIFLRIIKFKKRHETWTENLGCNYPLETQFHWHPTSKMSKSQHDSVIETRLPSIHITALYFTWTCSSCQAKKNLIISFSTPESFKFSKWYSKTAQVEHSNTELGSQPIVMLWKSRTLDDRGHKFIKSF